MLEPNKIIKNFTFIIAVIVMSAALSYAVMAAWTEPDDLPPICNSGDPGCDTPINVSAIGQIKRGTFGINYGNDGVSGGAPNGLIIYQGKVGIGTANPKSTLDVNGNLKVGGTTEGLGSAPNYAGLYMPDVDILVGGGNDSTFVFRHLDNPANSNKNLIVFGNERVGGAIDDFGTMILDTENNKVSVGPRKSGLKPNATLEVIGNVMVGNTVPVQANHGLCWRGDKTIGYCSTGLDVSGVCACEQIN